MKTLARLLFLSVFAAFPLLAQEDPQPPVEEPKDEMAVEAEDMDVEDVMDTEEVTLDDTQEVTTDEVAFEETTLEVEE